MFVWYGMLWAIIEACIDPNEGRNIDLRGPFRRDIDQLADVLRRCRNAVLHVPRTGDYLDVRIQALVQEPASAVTIRRMSTGLERLFLEEFARRRTPFAQQGAEMAGEYL